MNLTKHIKWQVILAALGVSFFMTSAVYAQEIDNTTFESPATSVGSNFNTPSAAAANAAVNSAQVEYAAMSRASILPADQKEETSTGRVPRTLGSLIALGVLLIGCGIVWKNASDRQNDTLKTHNSVSLRKSSTPDRKTQAQHS